MSTVIGIVIVLGALYGLLQWALRDAGQEMRGHDLHLPKDRQL